MQLIETHADALAEALKTKIKNSERCADYCRVPPDELTTLVGGIYGHLGEWLVTKTEHDLERRYVVIGRRRAEQGIPPTQMLWCIVLVKENLWDYLRENDILQDTTQVFGELELVRMVDEFFDRAMYYALCGYESARHERELMARAARR